MKNEHRAKQQLISELAELRQRVAELEASETERRRVEGLYGSMVELAPDSIITLDMKGVITSCNTAATRILGYSKDELTGKHFSKLGVLRARDIPEFLKLFKSALMGELTKPLELGFRRKDGTSILAEVRVGLLKKNGKTIGLQAISTDITERKRAEESLRESEEKYRLLVENSRETIFVAQDGMLKFFNSQAMEITGYSREKLASKPFVELIHPDDREMVVERHLKRLKGESLPHVYPFRIIERSGNIKWVEINAVLITWEGKPATLNFLSDITERKRAEDALQEYSVRLEEMVEERTQELRDAQEQLVRREKLAVLGQLAGGVGHELRNPLGVISNAVYFLQMTLPHADETTKEYLEIISEEVRNSTKIVSDLLDFSRTRLPDREEAAVSELVAEVLEKRPPPENVEVITQIAPDLPPVYVDPRQMEQVLGNLVSNAYQAMKEGGALTIKTARLSSPKSSEVYEKLPKSKWVALSISDTGCGISQENMAKLFEPLFTAKARGIGLGLVVSRSLVEANGGSMEVESEEGKGSTFTVRLPIREVAA